MDRWRKDGGDCIIFLTCPATGAKIETMETVKLNTLNEGDKFRFRYQDSSKRIYQVQHKLITQTGGIGVLEVTGSDKGVYHPSTDVIPE